VLLGTNNTYYAGAAGGAVGNVVTKYLKGEIIDLSLVTDTIIGAATGFIKQQYVSIIEPTKKFWKVVKEFNKDFIEGGMYVGAPIGSFYQWLISPIFSPPQEPPFDFQKDKPPLPNGKLIKPEIGYPPALPLDDPSKYDQRRESNRKKMVPDNIILIKDKPTELEDRPRKPTIGFPKNDQYLR
jgi:hypothetical protein